MSGRWWLLGLVVLVVVLSGCGATRSADTRNAVLGAGDEAAAYSRMVRTVQKISDKADLQCDRYTRGLAEVDDDGVWSFDFDCTWNGRKYPVKIEATSLANGGWNLIAAQIP